MTCFKKRSIYSFIKPKLLIREKMKNIPKANETDFIGRCREIISDPNNVRIPRVDSAGLVGTDTRFKDPFILMHNGIHILIGENGYYEEFSNILGINRGVHEPQEEYAFSQILKHVNPKLPMLELGAYWGFYSLWYKKHCPESKVYLMEPEKHNLQVGKNNFLLNRQEGTFINNLIGEGGMDVEEFLVENRIQKLSILHVDIQGAEMYLLNSISTALDDKKIEYIFLSTHSQELHIDCVKKLEKHGYKILCSADFAYETFSYDGIIVACDPEMGIEPFDIYSRVEHSIDTECKL